MERVGEGRKGKGKCIFIIILKIKKYKNKVREIENGEFIYILF